MCYSTISGRQRVGTQGVVTNKNCACNIHPRAAG